MDSRNHWQRQHRPQWRSKPRLFDSRHEPRFRRFRGCGELLRGELLSIRSICESCDITSLCFFLLSTSPSASTIRSSPSIQSSRSTLDVPGKRIHWAGGRDEPPPDTPECGFDGSKCIDEGSFLCLVLVFDDHFVLPSRFHESRFSLLTSNYFSLLFQCFLIT